MQTKTIQKYFLFSLLFATLIFTFFIFQPFWVVLVLGASFAVVLHPIYKYLNKIKIPGSLSAFITVSLFVIILCIPILTMSSVIFKQSQNVYSELISNQQVGIFLDKMEITVNGILPDSLSLNTDEIASNFISFLTKNITNIFNTSISAILSSVLFLLAIFYFLKDGEEWKRKIILLSPLSLANDEKIIKRFSKTITGVIKGYLLISLIQGILMWLGLYIFGVPNSAFWGLIAAIAALIPPFGTALVSIPAIIYLFFTGPILPVLGLSAWSLLMVGMIDNLLNPYIVGRELKIPAFLVLFSVLGGIALLGPVGILIGPLSVSLLYTLISIYKDEPI